MEREVEERKGESDRSQQRECERGGKSVRERERMRRKGRIKQQAKWEKKGEGESLRSAFSLQRDKRLQHDGGRCQVMCDKSKLKMT